jgi:hypothetical protein
MSCKERRREGRREGEESKTHTKDSYMYSYTGRRTFLLYKFFQHLEQNKTNLHKRKNTHNTHDTHARPAAAWSEEENLCRDFSSVGFWRLF